VNATEGGVWAAIDNVLDPCSRFNGTRLSFVELGMVDSVEIDGTVATVTLLLDTPSCAYVYEIERSIREQVLADCTEIDQVFVDLTAREPWTEDRMTKAARTKMEARRRMFRATLDLVQTR